MKVYVPLRADTPINRARNAPGFFMGIEMRLDTLRSDLIASLQREQLAAANIISDLSFDDPRMTALELQQEITRSKLRRGSLAYTEENLLIIGVSR